MDGREREREGEKETEGAVERLGVLREETGSIKQGVVTEVETEEDEVNLLSVMWEVNRLSIYLHFAMKCIPSEFYILLKRHDRSPKRPNRGPSNMTEAPRGARDRARARGPVFPKAYPEISGACSESSDSKSLGCSLMLLQPD